MKWMERAQREICETPERHTDNTDERNLTSVTSVPIQGFSEKIALLPDDLLEEVEVLERDGGLRRGTVSAAAEHTPRRWWRIRRQDGQEVSVYCSPMASLAEMRERHPDALSLEPYEPERRPGRPLTTAEEVAIRAWLVSIGETDPGSVAAVLAQCAQDADALEYYVARGLEAAGRRKPNT